MEPGCKLEDFGRLAQPAATNRLRCRVNVVSERYLVETCFWCGVLEMLFGLCMAYLLQKWFGYFLLFLFSVPLGLGRINNCNFIND
jgi:hypothetical protein